MRIIGLTGGIACGKSTVSAYLQKKGAVIIDADKVSWQLSEPHNAVWQAYVNHFGTKILNADNSLNRRLIGKIVFTDKEEKNWMNKNLHPIIKETVLRQIEQCRKNKVKVVVLDIPLLYEAGWDKLADEVWVVKISRQLQIKRIQDRDNLTVAEAESRIDAQMPLEEKANRADVVIDSSTAPEITMQEVERICKQRNLDF